MEEVDSKAMNNNSTIQSVARRLRLEMSSDSNLSQRELLGLGGVVVVRRWILVSSESDLHSNIR